MKYGLLFSGQGAQRPGMGIDFLVDPLFKKIVATASAATQLDLVQIMRGTAGELTQTRFVQPALATVAYGIYRMLMRDLALPLAGMVGLSLGEYPALMAAGAVDFPSGMALLAARANYMETDALTRQSGLVALIDYQPTAVAHLLKLAQQAQVPVYPANYNSPGRWLWVGPQAPSQNLPVKCRKPGPRSVW